MKVWEENRMVKRKSRMKMAKRQPIELKVSKTQTSSEGLNDKDCCSRKSCRRRCSNHLSVF